MYATDRQTDIGRQTSDVKRASSLNAPTLEAGHNKKRHCGYRDRALVCYVTVTLMTLVER